jgi:hypothetical protein
MPSKRAKATKPGTLKFVATNRQGRTYPLAMERAARTLAGLLF